MPISPRKSPNALMNCGREGVVPYGRFKNLPPETRAKEHFSKGELNSKMRSKNKSIWVFFSSVGNFFASHFSVRLHWRIVFFGSGSHCKVFLVSLMDRALDRNSLARFPTTQQWQRTARAPLRPQLPRGQSREMVPPWVDGTPLTVLCTRSSAYLRIAANADAPARARIRSLLVHRISAQEWCYSSHNATCAAPATHGPLRAAARTQRLFHCAGSHTPLPPPAVASTRACSAFF